MPHTLVTAFKVSSLFLCYVLSTAAVAQDTYNRIDIPIDTGQLRGVDQSMQSIFNMGLVPMSVHKFAFDRVWRKNDTKSKRTTKLFASYAITQFYTYPVTMYFIHEHGHLQGQRFSGQGSEYGSAISPIPWIRLFKDAGTFRLSGSNTWQGMKTSGAFDATTTIDPYDAYTETTVAGFNATTTFNAIRAEGVRRNNAIDALDTPNYFSEKFEVMRYPAGPGDKDEMLEAYNGRRYNQTGFRSDINTKDGDPKLNSCQDYMDDDGNKVTVGKEQFPSICKKPEFNYGITESDLTQAQVLSVVASASTYNYIFSAINYVHNGNTVAAPKFHTIGGTKFVYPDTEFYLSARGISYRLASGYQLSKKIYIPFSYEQVTKGQKGTQEIGIGVDYTTDTYTARTKMFNSKGNLSARFDVDKPLGKGTAYLNFQYLNWDGMDSRRYIFNTKGKKTATNIIIGYRYPLN